jgi:hypothetical protein
MVLSYCGVFSILCSVSSVMGYLSVLYYAVSVGVCYRAGVWMEPAVELQYSVRIKYSCFEVV